MNAEEARRLLPWYAVGALDPAEAHDVESELTRSVELRRELEEFRALEQTMHRSEAQMPRFRAELIEDAWRRIDDYEKSRSQPAGRDNVTSLDSFRRRVAAGWSRTPLATRFALAAQFAAIFVLAGFLLMPASVEQGFTTMSDATATADGNGPRFTVVFAPDATEARIRELLDGARLQILSGPSGQAAYIVGPQPGETLVAEEALDKLRAASDAVRYAARVEPGT